jgi:ABC-type transport system involved in cytochrome c biogenesis ATPase subunit
VSEPLLRVSDLYTAYGLCQVLFGVSLEVARGECVSLLGRNGVGKTTTMRSIMGLTPPTRGRVEWKGQDIAGRAPHDVAKRGLGFVPEDRRIFADLTVWENLDVATRGTRNGGFTLERVYELFPKLAELRDRQGGYLSGGEQQMLTIGRTSLDFPRRPAAPSATGDHRLSRSSREVCPGMHGAAIRGRCFGRPPNRGPSAPARTGGSPRCAGWRDSRPVAPVRRPGPERQAARRAH